MSFKGDPSLAKLPNLLEFVTQLKKASAANERECEDDSFATTLAYDHGKNFCKQNDNDQIKKFQGKT